MKKLNEDLRLWDFTAVLLWYNTQIEFSGVLVRTPCPWREHLLHAVATAELSSPCCIRLPGGAEWTGERRGEKQWDALKHRSVFISPEEEEVRVFVKKQLVTTGLELSTGPMPWNYFCTTQNLLRVHNVRKARQCHVVGQLRCKWSIFSFL